MKYFYIFAMKRALLHQCPAMKHSFHLSGYPVACSREKPGIAFPCFVLKGEKPEAHPLSGTAWGVPSEAKSVMCRGEGPFCQLCCHREPGSCPLALQSSSFPSPCLLWLCMDAAFPSCLAKSMSDDHLLHAKGIGGMETRKEFSSTQKTHG